MTKSSSTQGFTLLELLTVLAVLGILLAIGVSAAAEWRRKLQADNFLAELARDFNVSRTRTLATGQVRRIRLVDNRSYVVETQGSTSTTWNTLQTATFPQPILDLSNSVARTYQFSTRGFMEAYNQSGQLTTSTTVQALLGSGLKTITVTALGIARRQ